MYSSADGSRQRINRVSRDVEQPPSIPADYGAPPHPHHGIHMPDTAGLYRIWDRFRGKGRRVPTVWKSIKNIITCSSLNILLLLIPVAWTAHYSYRIPDKESGHNWPESLIFSLCFLSIVPLENLFDWGGEQMSLYLGKDLGDLVIISLNNAVEATLAIILLVKCELKLLQSTLMGVILLHLLLIPGTAFIVGGANTMEQSLHPHHVSLNHGLLLIGVLSLLVPTAIFAALGGSSTSVSEAAAATTSTTASTSEVAARMLVARAGKSDPNEPLKLIKGGLTAENIVSDTSRDTFLTMSYGIAILLLLVYIASRIFFHNPPGEDNAGRVHHLAPEQLKEEEKRLAEEDPETNVWVCIVMLILAIGLMAITAEFLVVSLEFLKSDGKVQEEWFGLILLPFTSFAADGAVAIIYFIKYLFRLSPPPPKTLAKARSIDLAIQFGLFWTPFVVLLGWWTNRPLMLLFDMYEITMLIAAAFLVNYITADNKTNWAEGFIMVAFYVIIALCTWFYSGQEVLSKMGQCGTTVAAALAASSATAAEGEGGH